jgi:lipid II:glycine glycyltransferase (peptidoglycan interpeptide bridge formation enzyme)
MLETEWQVEVDQVTAEGWSQMLDLFQDASIYQTWSYGRVRWGVENLSHLVLKRRGEVVGIAQFRIVRPKMFKFGMAYLRWGPLCERRGVPLDPAVVGAMARAIEDEYVSNRKLFLRVLPNAFAGSPRAAVIQSAFERFEVEAASPENTYRTFVVDLEPGLEELRKKLDAKWRNHLSRGERNNLKVIAGDGIVEYRVFCAIYNRMRERKTFDTTVDVNEFGRIQDELADPFRMRTFICEDQGAPVAAVVVSAIGDSAIYLLGATTEAGMKSQGSYVLHWTIIQWLKSRGIRWYDLGGIDPVVNPGVYSFKKGFSGADLVQLHPMIACRSILSSTAVKLGLGMQMLRREWMRTSLMSPLKSMNKLA